ncbi:hypothetical protein [Paraburkholderia graminis]|uniref:hypothetical protein n=1 Tax=Paraburkholderia graminis TaxID=60548 RepID=UPI00279221A2|nr:hypothetical protein [Paraburkholderia graminis]MDQ0626013.1 hypothetical protein [Paraburkholderia graminis]
MGLLRLVLSRTPSQTENWRFPLKKKNGNLLTFVYSSVSTIKCFCNYFRREVDVVSRAASDELAEPEIKILAHLGGMIMPSLTINFDLWNAASADDQQKIVSALKEHGLLEKNETVIGDKNVPAPSPDTPVHGATVGDFKLEGGFFDNPVKEICKVGCDAAAAAAVAALTLEGPALAAAAVAIAAAREACRDRC